MINTMDDLPMYNLHMYHKYIMVTIDNIQWHLMFI